jgi:hypothetical protein
LKSEVVSTAAVTRPLRSAAASVSGASIAVRGSITSVPPFSSAPQISHVAASNEMLAACATRSAAVSCTKSVSRTSRTMAWCGSALPFGRPVEPEV